MIKDLAILFLSGITLILIPFTTNVRDAFTESTVISKYKEVLNSSAVMENQDKVRTLTGKKNDWTAIPSFLLGKSRTIDIATFATMLPVLVMLFISIISIFKNAFKGRKLEIK